MINKFDYKKLLNFSKSKYSYNDYLYVKDLFNRIEEDDELRKQLFIQWKEFAESNNKKDDSLDHIFEKIQYSILLEEKRKEKKKIIWNFYRQAAAILIIPVLMFSVWYYISSQNSQDTSIEQYSAESWVEINAPDGARVQFFLPDSTVGWLNSGSKLKYPVVFNQNRRVELIGEAYLDVKYLESSKFVVNVADFDVKVLGTKFNVSAYSDDAFADVVLMEGKVEINGKTGNFTQILSPDEKLTFNRESRALNLAKVDASQFSAWKDGFLIIENEPLRQVVKRIERWYNAEITIQDEILNSYRFKATFKDEPLEEVLRLIALTTPISYTIQKREFDKNGIVKQRKVSIKLKL